MQIQWTLAIFTLLAGAGGWLFAAIAVNHFTGWSKRDPFPVALVALVIVGLGGLASVGHLAHPERIMNALAHAGSGISTEAAATAATLVLGAAQAVSYKRGSAGASKVLAVLTGVCGIVLSFVTGNSYSSMVARTAWNTALLPLAYLGTGAAMGLALHRAIACRGAADEPRPAALAAGVAGLVGTALVLAYAVAAGVFDGAGAGFAAGSAALTAVAAVAGLAGWAKPHAALAWAGVACSVAGGLLLRLLMWTAITVTYGFFG